MLRATTYADQIVACNQAAQCFAKNDSPFEFRGELSLQLHNVQTGSTALVRRLPLKLSAGAGTVEWFCASNSSSSSTTSAVGGDYSYHPCQVPTVGAFVAHHFPTVVSQLQCQAWCDANNTCAGFTRANRGVGCTFYCSSRSGGGGGSNPVPVQNLSSFQLGNSAGADWWQKRSIAPLKSVDTPYPTCRVPEPAVCQRWASIRQWREVGCLPAGENCVVEMSLSDARNSTAASATLYNMQPFVAPLRMQLPKNVSVTVDVGGLPCGDNEIQISVRCARGATALYVILTTAAEGRFSENAFLLEGGAEAKNVSFVAWRPLTDSTVQLLRSSLRVEHLAEYL